MSIIPTTMIPPTTYPSEIYQTIEATNIEGSLTFTTNGTINALSVTADLITDGTATLTNGYLHGIVNNSNTSSAVNKAYVDNIFSTASGSNTWIQFATQGTLGSSANLTISGNILNVSNISTTSLSTSVLNINGIHFTDNSPVTQLLIFPSTTGTSGSVLQLQANNQLQWVNHVSTPGGPTGSIQFNSAGTFDGSSNLTYTGGLNSAGFIGVASSASSVNTSTHALDISNINTQNVLELIAPSSLSTSYNIRLPSALPTSASFFVTDGSGNLSFTTGQIAQGPFNSIQYTDGTKILGSSTLLYDSMDNELSVTNNITISNIITPVTLTSLSLTTQPISLSIKGNYCYASGSDMISVINNFTDPIIVSTISYPGILGTIPDPINNLLYTRTSDIFGISVLTSIEIPIVTMSITGINNFSYVSPYVYVSAQTSVVIDCSNVLNPVTISKYGNTTSSIYYNDLIYVSNSSGLLIYDYSNVTPTTLGSVSVSNLNQLQLQNNYVYGTDGTIFYEINVSNHTNPIVTTSYNFGSINEFIVTGNELFVLGNTLLSRTYTNNFITINTLGITGTCMALSLDGYLYLNVNPSLYHRLNIYSDILGAANIDALMTETMLVEDLLMSDASLTAQTTNIDTLFIQGSITGQKNIISISNYGTCITNSGFGKIHITNPDIISPGTTKILTVNNNLCTTDTIVKVAVNSFNSGFPSLSIVQVSSGQFIICILNVHKTEIMNNSITISYALF